MQAMCVTSRPALQKMHVSTALSITECIIREGALAIMMCKTRTSNRLDLVHPKFIRHCEQQGQETEGRFTC
jgi:hypothetical protein